MSNKSSKSNFGRRTWDEDEYNEKAKARREQRLKNGKFSKATSIEKFYKDRAKLLKQVDTYSGSNLLSGDKAKYAGFYCESCRRTFRDNLAFVSHLNGKEHLVKSGISGLENSKKYTVNDVKRRLNYLRDKVIQMKHNNGCNTHLIAKDERLEKRRRKRKEQRHRKKLEDKISDTEESGINELQKQMGFSNFGS